MLKRVLIPLMLCLPLAAQIAAPPRVGVGNGKRDLSLAQAIELALKKNLSIEIEKTNVESAETAAVGAKGFLDPNFGWQPRYEDRSTPTSSSLAGVDGQLKEKIHSQDFFYNQLLPWWGSGLQVAYENDRQSTNSPFVSLSPFVSSRLTVSFNLPLLRNRPIDVMRANLKLTNTQVDLSSTQFEIEVIETVSQVEQAYWNLVAARQNVEVAGEAVNLGREQLARTKRMIDSGTLASVEIAAAEAELERRVDTWYSSIGMVTELENALKLLITENREDPSWDDEIVPTEEKIFDPPNYEFVREAVDLAVARRPELRQVSLQMDSNNIRSELAKNQTKPELNLVGGYSAAGLAGDEISGDDPFSGLLGAQFERVGELSAIHGLTPLPPPEFGGIPPSQIGGFGQASKSVFNGSFPTVFVGLKFDWTARNRAANAELTETIISERRLKLRRQQVEQLITAQVRNALQAIQTARQRITAAEASARAAQEKLASEIRLFQSGESTNFLVLTRQNELADSRQRVVVARLDFNKAVARVRQAVGTTLDTYGIDI